MDSERTQQFVQSQVQETFGFIGIDIKDLVVSENPPQGSPEIYSWNWSVTRKTGQIIKGVVQFSELSQDDMTHPGFLRIQIACAVAIGLHPMANAINEFLLSYRSETIQEYGRNSMIEMMTRSVLNGMIADGITKPNALNKFVELIHLKQNIAEKYAFSQRKRH